VVEVDILVEPLDAEVVLAAVLKGDVNGSQVLATTHRADPGVGGIVGWCVVKSESHRQPSLLDFRVGVNSSVVVSVDSGKEVEGDLRSSCLESVVEDYLQVTVEREIVLIVGGA